LHSPSYQANTNHALSLTHSEKKLVHEIMSKLEPIENFHQTTFEHYTYAKRPFFLNVNILNEINTTRQSITQHFVLYKIKYYIFQSDIFRTLSVVPEALQENRSNTCLSFHCTVGFHMFTKFCYRNVKYIILYILNLLCHCFSIKIL